LLSAASLTAQAERGFAPAAAFPVGLPWLNVERPLTLEALRGKVVALDFWTYGCINCLHVAEELKALERRFGDRLAVIGVHSPKFDNERNLATLRRNILRYGLRHPVVQDEDYRLMKAYGAPAWPTVAVIDPAGRYVARLVGEGNVQRLGRIVSYLLEQHADILDETPLPLLLEEVPAAASGLAGPGKVAADAEWVAVSDTLHHRIVVADTRGRVHFVFGSDEADLVDGSAAEARFNAPQGLVIDEGRIYVADAGNHVVRLIDLATAQVSTLAGTGKIGHRPRLVGEGDGRGLELRSPWDLALDGEYLYIAAAGSHQILRLGLTDGRLSPFAGSGREGLEDGPASRATFSQPSGIAIAGRSLYVADAEASAVRRIELDTETVTTLVGTGLFDFGDRDGGFDIAQLQHPASVVAWGPDSLLLADTYNHKLRRLDLERRTVTTLAGDGQPGAGTGSKARFNEPSGLATLGDMVLVADTHNDRLVSFDPASGAVEEWRLLWPDADGGAHAASSSRGNSTP
jgi:thiol-disulfide isomerase/thioredoxin